MTILEKTQNKKKKSIRTCSYRKEDGQGTRYKLQSGGKSFFGGKVFPMLMCEWKFRKLLRCWLLQSNIRGINPRPTTREKWSGKPGESWTWQAPFCAVFSVSVAEKWIQERLKYPEWTTCYLIVMVEIIHDEKLCWISVTKKKFQRQVSDARSCFFFP